MRAFRMMLVAALALAALPAPASAQCMPLCPFENSEGPVAVSGTGNADGDVLAVSATRNAQSGVLALALLGSSPGNGAGGTVAVAGTGNAAGLAAVSVAGNADGLVAVSLLGHASGPVSVGGGN